MQARKWNETKGTYDPYELPEGSSKYENDMDVIVSCACCGKKITYGDAYTSHKIYDHIGFGYVVCGDCYFDKGM